jgi:tRNA (Thr-GGU) A37 N-methylase
LNITPIGIIHSPHSSPERTPIQPRFARGLSGTAEIEPHRPNPIGLSLVRLIRIEGNNLHLEDLDLLDGTPILDIKPNVPDFDRADQVRCGWYEHVDPATAEARGRRQYRADESPGKQND